MPLPYILQPAPAFTAPCLHPNKDMGTLTLSDYRGKWVVFFWYPLDFTYVCPTEIIAFGDRQPEFEAINAQVIAASCDSLFCHLAWVNLPRADGGLGPMKIPILGDFDKKVATSYGVLLGDGVPTRALFIIDPAGIVRQITCNDISVGRNVDEILRLIKAHQFVEKYGEVCPAGWQPGDLAMAADPERKKEWFRDTFKAEPVSPMNQSSVQEVVNIGVFANHVNSNDLTVVDYWAPWCKNCKKISPTIAGLAAEFPDVKFLKINTIEAEDISVDNGVDALPTIQFFKRGKMITEFKGSDIGAVDKIIRSHIAQNVTL